MRRLLITLSAVLLAWPAPAQTYPSRPIRMIVPFPPGGAVDTTARLVSERLAAQMGQPVVVENRAGANGTVGARAVADSTADGYTLVYSASIHVINPLVMRQMPYDVERDFTAIAHVAQGPLLFVAHPSITAPTLRELAAQARAEPTKFNFATSSRGSAGHIATEIFKRSAGADLVVAPYRGAAPALQDVTSNQVQLMIDPILSSLPQVRAGVLRGVAITAATRSPAAPEIPTAAEQGMPELEMYSWYGIWGPRGLPRPIVERLAAEVRAAVATDRVKDRMISLGFEPTGMDPDAFQRYQRAEIEKYAEIVRTAKIEAE
jgi:tripartite-type tricarboxylate transporter receptor subunit TctC